MRIRRLGTPASWAPLFLLLAACATGPDGEQEGRTWVWTRLDLAEGTEGGPASLRGLSVVDERTVWCGGSGGTLLRTTDAGSTWIARPVPGCEDLDFRSICALDADRVWVASAGPGEASRIYHTEDGGRTWNLQHTNRDPAGFFDAIAFWPDDEVATGAGVPASSSAFAGGARGLVVGDPVDGRLTILRTLDGGRTWGRVSASAQPPSPAGEYAFAASGTSIVLVPPASAWIVTGGSTSRLWRSIDGGASWTARAIPLGDGGEAAGAFSVATLDGVHGLAVGGDYTKPAQAARHFARTTDGGRTWLAAESAAASPAGYRSCVAAAPGSANRVWIAVGTSGTDASFDGGLTWTPIGSDPLHSLAFTPSGRAAYATGPAASIRRLCLD